MSCRSSTLRDLDIRRALIETISRSYDLSDTVVIEELGICRGRVRVDVAVVNGELHGFEIKSERDSLRRLDSQVDFYGKVLDRATLVLGQRHLTRVLELLPDWWGIVCIYDTSERLEFEVIREGRENPQKDPRSLVEFLWHEEALNLLELRGVARGVRGKPRRLVWDRLCRHFSLDEISGVVRTQLKARTRNPILE
jgi:hypothetical protein